MGFYVRLVKRCGVDHGIDPLEASPHHRAVENGPDDIGMGRCKQVEADDLLTVRGELSDERLSQVPGAARHQDPHLRAQILDARYVGFS